MIYVYDTEQVGIGTTYPVYSYGARAHTHAHTYTHISSRVVINS